MVDAKRTNSGPQESIYAKIDCTCRDHNCHGKDTYELPVMCSNCRLQGTGIYTKGHEAYRSRCPECDTLNIRPKWSA